ncbi:receptor-like protein 7 [Rhodamnia argentea]|uniref:Receptor-like protein 7 n=1 Tax=Rhodamnia argentea TaxID=178133 RepID=A0ABM3H4Q7_9MYRT|nr:receptor-like protein 7 [Rhodamnia argentea]
MAPSIFFPFCSWIVFLILPPASFANSLCHPDESSALMEFKQSFRINRTEESCDYPKVESWSLARHGDCCSWDGVRCDEATGHVTGLDLNGSCLFGTITSNTSLFRLLHLESLNLAFNDFNFSSIPYGFGNLSKLHYLNLSDSKFSGKVPSDISRLSRLISLDLSFNGDLEMPNLGNFVENLTMLRELDLSSITMSSPFPHVLANLSSLKSLKLVECQLHGEFPVSIFQLPNLEVLNVQDNGNLYGFIPELHWGNPLKSLSLSGTNFSGEIPVSIGNLIFLNELLIWECDFSGSLPGSLGNLSELALTDIYENKFQGSPPASLGNLSKLTYLAMSMCEFQGQIPASFANLTRLSSLYLSSTNFSGGIWHWLANLAKRTELDLTDLSGNNLSGTVDLHRLENLKGLSLDFNNISFVGRIEMNTTLPKLSSLRLESCNLHEFPKLLGHLNGLESIQLSHNKIGGSIPSWMGNGSRESLWYLDLSHNFLTGFVDNRINLLLPNLTYLDISSNSLKTGLPTPPPSVSYYNISNNILFGDIQSICRAKSLVILDLSINSPNGTIPSCLKNIHSLAVLNLGKNKLDGSIPQAYPKGCALTLIDLLSELTNLKVIILKSNNFHGPIKPPQSQFNFSNLHVMDLSDNSFNGELPSKLLQSFHAMKVVAAQDRLEYMSTTEEFSRFIMPLDYGMKLTDKGTEREYSKVPYALMGIDLSNNKFEGCILDPIGDLKSLLMLNLSNNVLTGPIPPSLANLTKLESLDLSRNKLSGEIPPQLAQLTFLAYFNVSHNQLSGPIPRESQFNTFTIDSFAMNEGLCGSPLPKKCTMAGDNLPVPPSPQEEIGEESPFNLDRKFVLIGAGVGFLIGAVLGNLIIDQKSRWFLHYSKRMAKRWNGSRRHRTTRSCTCDRILM